MWIYSLYNSQLFLECQLPCLHKDRILFVDSKYSNVHSIFAFIYLINKSPINNKIPFSSCFISACLDHDNCLTIHIKPQHFRYLYNLPLSITQIRLCVVFPLNSSIYFSQSVITLYKQYLRLYGIDTRPAPIDGKVNTCQFPLRGHSSFNTLAKSLLSSIERTFKFASIDQYLITLYNLIISFN